MRTLQPFSIGEIAIDPPLILAPMAGISHSPFRKLVAHFSKPGLFFSEMLSARHLPDDIKKKSLWLRRTEAEYPLAYQLVAPTPQEAALGARHMHAYGGEIIDLNLACPAPNIKGRQAGGYLLSDLSLIHDMLSAMRASVSCPLTVKIRLGTKPDLQFLQELVAVIEQNQVNAITLHPRLTTEKLKRRARWEYIGHLKRMTKLPVIGNGDVTTREDCCKMFQETGCDGVMIGRAAVQKPWLFAEICGQDIRVSKQFLHETYFMAATLITDFFPPEKAIGRIKEFTWYFSRNMLFGHRFAARIQSISSLDKCLQFAQENFLSSCS